ncbi:MAG: ABC transporter permease [Alphaproteobacteria bacterium]|nr:ABC transporter permease [Alphaproteobacteria bacterium]
MMPKTTQHFTIISLLTIIALCLLGMFWQPYSIIDIDIGARFALPSFAHPFGRDYLGRDILSLLLFGMGQSLLIASIAIIPSAICAIFLGFIAAYYPRIGVIITALFGDFLFAFPTIITAIFIAAFFGVGRYVPILAIALFSLPVLLKLTKSQILTLQSAYFIKSAHLLGASFWQVCIIYYLPNIKKPLIVQIASLFTIGILTEAGLSYLGFGASPDQMSLGKMLFDAQNFFHIAPHMAIVPGLTLTLIVININILIDQYNDNKPVMELRF